jgi:hypothetical protein
MQLNRKLATTVLALFMLLAASDYGVAQQPKSLLATADGEGTLKVGQEQFKVSTVIVKLLEDSRAEITLVSDITIFVNGTWSKSGETEKEIALEITGSAAGSNLRGNGKLVLREDNKSIQSLVLQGTHKTTKRNIGLNFVAK